MWPCASPHLVVVVGSIAAQTPVQGGREIHHMAICRERGRPSLGHMPPSLPAMVRIYKNNNTRPRAASQGACNGLCRSPPARVVYTHSMYTLMTTPSPPPRKYGEHEQRAQTGSPFACFSSDLSRFPRMQTRHKHRHACGRGKRSSAPTVLAVRVLARTSAPRTAPRLLASACFCMCCMWCWVVCWIV